MKRIPVDIAMLTDKERRELDIAKFSGVVQVILTGDSLKMINKKHKILKQAIKECRGIN